MNPMWRVVGPGLASAATLLAALAVRAALERALRRRMRALDALAALLKAVHAPALLWAVVLAVYVAIEASELGLSRSLLNLAERDGRASYPQFTAARGIPTERPPARRSILSQWWPSPFCRR